MPLRGDGCVRLGRTQITGGKSARFASHPCGPTNCRRPPARPRLPTITLNVYGHLFGNSHDRAAEIVEAAFGKALALTE